MEVNYKNTFLTTSTKQLEVRVQSESLTIKPTLLFYHLKQQRNTDHSDYGKYFYSGEERKERGKERKNRLRKMHNKKGLKGTRKEGRNDRGNKIKDGQK